MSQSQCDACGSSISTSCHTSRLTAEIACWLSTRHTSGMRSPKNYCTKSCTGSPTFLFPWLRATTSLSAVLHEVADWPEDLHAREHIARLWVTSSKCIPLTLRVVQASPFQSESVESSSCRPVTSSGESVPTNSRDAINLTSAASSGTVHRVTLVVNLRTAVEISGLPQRCKERACDVARTLTLVQSRLVVGVSPLRLRQVGRRHWIQLGVRMAVLKARHKRKQFVIDTRICRARSGCFRENSSIL